MSLEASKSRAFNFDQNSDYFIKPAPRSTFLKTHVVFLLIYHLTSSVGERRTIARKQASPALSSLVFQLHDRRRKKDDELKISMLSF